jgi:hypothetical protein
MVEDVIHVSLRRSFSPIIAPSQKKTTRFLLSFFGSLQSNIRHKIQGAENP